MTVDATLWMPEEMDPSEKAAWDASAPGDPHLAAGRAWESWAAEIKASGQDVEVASVSTGAQSVSYVAGTSASQRALDIAAWHYAKRGKGAVLSPDYNRTPDAPFTSLLPPTWPRSTSGAPWWVSRLP